MAESTGKAATGIDGITLHSAFHPPKSRLKLFEHKKPSDEILCMFRNKHQYLKVLMGRDISDMKRNIWAFRSSIKSYHAKFVTIGGVSLLVVGDFLQLPPVKQKGVFMKPSKGSDRSFNRWLWEKFQLHELVEIVQQSSDPDSAQLLNRVQESQQTNNEVIQIKALANTVTAAWPDEFVEVYFNNYLAGQENEDYL